MMGVGNFDNKVPRAEPDIMTADKAGCGIVEDRLNYWNQGRM